ncbi:MAG: HlyD family secretion protein [Longimicrobiales bacterium]
MDIRREKKKNHKRYVYIGLGVAVVALVTVGISRLEPAAPTVDGATVWRDTVREGTMVRQVRGPGTLVPERIRWISAVTAGRVERVNLEPGTPVEPTTVLLEMSNPDVQLELLEAQRQLTQAQSELVNLRATLEAQRLNQRAVVASAYQQLQEANRTLQTNRELQQRNLVAANDVKTAEERAEELATRYEVEQDRLRVMTEAMQAQLAVQQAQIERLHSIVAFRRDQVGSMVVRAGAEGVLQDLPMEVGQWVTPGIVLARIVEPGRLKAVIRVPETQAPEVQLGQRASIDTRNGVVEGTVVRMDPSVQNGTVQVDVRIDGDLPPGSRPDLSVDGTIEIERLEDVNYVGRPAYGQANSTVGLFKLVENGTAAIRVNVRLGRSSVNTIEVVNGLAPGDVVILSDMSAWDHVDRVRLR